MKKRILSLALTLCLLAGLLPCLTVGAVAADRVDAAPYASVEYTKNADVKTGTVRYVCQVPAYSDLFCSDYWGSYGNYANHECFTACISMALSYLGLDATPGALGDYWRSRGHYGTPFATTPDDVAFSGATYSKASLAEAIARYVDGEGSYSPPIIHLNGYSANGHYVMIIGQVSATEYRVLDPAVKSIYSMTLTNGSTVHYFKGSERVTEAVQYYYPVHHWSAWTAIETDDGAVDMERTCVDCGKTETARIPDPCVGDEYCAGGVFDDMPAASDWMHEGIDYCVLFGLMNGVGKNQFDPMGQTTRAMLVSILYRMADEPDVSELPEAPFVDVSDGAWYTAAVRWAMPTRSCSARTTRTLRRMPASRARSWSRCSTAPTARKRASARARSAAIRTGTPCPTGRIPPRRGRSPWASSTARAARSSARIPAPTARSLPCS